MIEIIPAIDIIEGKCVRLSQGDYGQKKVYNENPLEVAKKFESEGIRRLHLVDLDGAKAKRIIHFKTLERIALKTSLVIDFGGGLQSEEDVRIAFESGARMITGGSIAVKDRALFLSWLKQYGNEKIILGADVKDRKIAVHGWQENTGIELMPFIREYTECGIQKVICTDIEKDGMMQGSAVQLYQDILKTFPLLYLVASGGVGSIRDIDDLQQSGVPAVIIGKALYEGTITLQELKKFIL